MWEVVNGEVNGEESDYRRRVARHGVSEEK
jgi:hypothetical protein